jgi:ABC-type Co2+ transport system permease subunit
MELADIVGLAYIVAGMAIGFAVYAVSRRCEKRQIRIWLILNAIAILALWLTTPSISGVPVALASYAVVIAGLGQRLRRKIRQN